MLETSIFELILSQTAVSAIAEWQIHQSSLPSPGLGLLIAVKKLLALQGVF